MDEIKEEYIFVCEDSVDGILTAVYNAWASKYGHNKIRIEVKVEEYNYRLFSTYIPVNTDANKVEKVINTIRKKISKTFLENILRAAYSCNPNKGTELYRCIRLGLFYGQDILTNYSIPCIQAVFEMNRAVANERHHYLGFLRFSELRERILYAKINPKNNILTLLAPHFVDRLPAENFIIHDEARELAVVHQVGENWALVGTNNIDFAVLGEVGTDEEKLEQLWKTFFASLSIKERENKKLQRNNLPLRFRDNMTEWKK